MEKRLSSIAIEVPDGYYPTYFEQEGRFLRIFLTEKNPMKFEITDWKVKNENDYGLPNQVPRF